MGSFFRIDEWRTLLDGVGVLAPLRDRLLADLRPSSRTVLRRGQPAAPGSSRLGGLPELPAGERWPVTPDGRPLWFLGQFDLATVRLGDAGLPGSGLLSVFHADPDEDEPVARVVWTPPGAALAELSPPGELVEAAAESRSLGYGRQGLFDPVSVTFESELVLPHPYDVVEPGTGYDDPVLVTLLAFQEITALRAGEARLLGWPEWEQDTQTEPGERLLLQIRCSHPAEDPIGLCTGDGSFFVFFDGNLHGAVRGLYDS